MKGEALALVLACVLGRSAAGQTLDEARLRIEAWNSDATRPVCATFVGPGELLVFQNADGRVVRIVDGTPMNEALDLDVSFQGARGIVSDPDVATNGYVYLYYGVSTTGDLGAWTETRVMRYTFDGANLVAPFGPLFTVPFDVGQSNTNQYNAGLLRFGPDGMLYGQVGDKGRGRSGNPRIEQNTDVGASSLAGGIFRIEPDGEVPADNPFLAAADPGVHPWFAYGFRNSLGMDFDPMSGSMWFSDNSVGDYDELNRADPGMNSGWLLIMGPDARDVTYSLNGNAAWDEVDLVALPGSFYRDPEFSYKDAIGITSVVFLDSKRFPEDLQDDLVVADVNLGQLYRFELDSSRESLVLSGGRADRVADSDAERDANRLGAGFGDVTDALVGPDGYLYVVSIDQGTVYRIRPLVDLYEPASIAVLEGSLVAGSKAELERSDDLRVAIGMGGSSSPYQERAIEASFVLNDAAPTRLDVVVESRASLTGVWQRIHAWHVPSASWFLLDARPTTALDQVVTVEQLPLPAEFVDPSTRTVRLRIAHRSRWHPLRRAGVPAAVPALVSELDQVRLLATLP